MARCEQSVVAGSMTSFPAGWKHKRLTDGQVSTETVGRPVDKVFVHRHSLYKSMPVALRTKIDQPNRRFLFEFLCG